MITAQPWDDHAAMAVLSALDPHDLIEAQLSRGAAASHLAIFADWRAMQAGALLSLVLRDEGRARQPFAVLALGHSGQAGVASAALLARSHKRHRAALVQVARRIGCELPPFCARFGLHRVEARCWAGHPTASRFLTACGFAHETDMNGFGASGAATFRQFAWIAPPAPAAPDPDLADPDPNPNGD